jgi:hypothetical protein
MLRKAAIAGLFVTAVGLSVLLILHARSRPTLAVESPRPSESVEAELLVTLVRGEQPDVSDKPAPPPPGGVFIDVQAISKGKPITEIKQEVFVAQLSRTTGTPNTVFRTGVNEIIKNPVTNTVSVKLGTTQKVR